MLEYDKVWFSDDEEEDHEPEEGDVGAEEDHEDVIEPVCIETDEIETDDNLADADKQEQMPASTAVKK